MSFQSVLKKIGSELNKFGEFIPLISLFGGDSKAEAVAAVANDGLQRAITIIGDMEAAGQAAAIPGSQKAAMTAPALAQLFLDLPILRGKKPKDPEAFKKAMTAWGGATADVLNQFEA